MITKFSNTSKLASKEKKKDIFYETFHVNVMHYCEESELALADLFLFFVFVY
jgi:hypothetical protein